MEHLYPRESWSGGHLASQESTPRPDGESHPRAAAIAEGVVERAGCTDSSAAGVAMSTIPQPVGSFGGTMELAPPLVNVSSGPSRLERSSDSS